MPLRRIVLRITIFLEAATEPLVSYMSYVPVCGDGVGREGELNGIYTKCATSVFLSMCSAAYVAYHGNSNR